MYSAGLKDLAEELVGKEKAEEFAAWAFGNDFESLNGMDKFADTWNERHGYLFKIDKDKPIVYDMIKMTNLWKEHG